LFAALVFRLNLAAVQLVNFLVYPLWFALLLPFVRVGERLFGVPPLAMTGSQMLALAHSDFLQSVGVLWLTSLRAAARLAAGWSSGNHRALRDPGANDPAHGSSSSSFRRASGRRF